MGEEGKEKQGREKGKRKEDLATTSTRVSYPKQGKGRMRQQAALNV